MPRLVAELAELHAQFAESFTRKLSELSE